MKHGSPRLLVLLPCFNEASNLPRVLEEIPRLIDGVSRVDILVVDDGSRDDSVRIARAKGATVISHGRNRGLGATFRTGLDYAIQGGYDLMVNVDSDGQFSPSDIPRLLAPILADEADFVSGSRFLSGEPIPHLSRVKRWGNLGMSSFISRLTRQRFSDVSCGFRAYSRVALLRLSLHGDFTYTQESFLTLAFKGLRIGELPVQVKYFSDRKSRVAGSVFKYALRTLAIILKTYRDYRPLRLFGTLGLAFLVPGVTLMAFLVVRRWVYGGFHPHIWAGFVGGALAFIAFLLMALGMVADMLVAIRMNQEEHTYIQRRLLSDGDRRGRKRPDNVSTPSYQPKYQADWLAATTPREPI